MDELIDISQDEVVDISQDEIVDPSVQAQPERLSPIVSPAQSISASTDAWQKQRETGTMRQAPDYTDFGHKAKAFSANVIPGYTAMAQGAQRLSGAMGLPAMSPEEVQEDITRSVEANPGSGMLGSVAQGVALAPFIPAAGVIATLPAAQRAMSAGRIGAGMAGTQYLTQKSNVDPGAPASQWVPETAAHMAVGGMGGKIADDLMPTVNPLAAPVAKHSASSIRDWADTYARQTLGIDSNEILRLQGQPSRLGLSNRYEDILEELTTNILPSGPTRGALSSPIALRDKAVANLKAGGEALDEIRAPMRVDVDSADLYRSLGDTATGIESRNVFGGNDAAGMIRAEREKLISQQLPGSPSWQSTTNLGELEKIGTAIRSPEYSGALKASDPTTSADIAVDALRSTQAHEAARVNAMSGQSSGIDPMEMMADDISASGMYEAKRKAAEIAAGVEGRTSLPPAVGYMSSASPVSQGVRGGLSFVKERGARMMVGAHKKALGWATKKLNEGLQRTGPIPGGIEPSGYTSNFNVNMSPFQLESFRRQVDALSKLDPGDFSVALYSMSTTDPVFNALWKMSQEEGENE